MRINTRCESIRERALGLHAYYKSTAEIALHMVANKFKIEDLANFLGIIILCYKSELST